MLPVSTPTADDGILAHLERMIAAMEARTSEQTTALMALVNAGYDTHAAEETLWHSVDNLLVLRRQQMRAREMLIDAASRGRQLDL